MTSRTSKFCQWTVVVIIVNTLVIDGALAAKRSMRQHMEIQFDVVRDESLAALPTVQIGSVISSVPMGDRLNADAAFDKPFVDSLKEAMAWYLNKKGLRVLPSGADLELTIDIVEYEGNKGWGDWGARMVAGAKLRASTGEWARGSISSNLRYSDDHAVQAEMRPRYKTRGLEVSFPEVLFTRVGKDLADRVILLLKGNSLDEAIGEGLPAMVPGRGRVTIEATVPNAEVWVDGKLVGTVPLRDLSLPAGTYRLEVRKEGYEPWMREVTIIHEAASRLVAELKASGQ